MIQGTGSSVGKSLVVAGLCRALVRRGLRCAPFKPQNMSNNAAVTAGGGEIGRAQALQARACGIAPSVDMNPVLLKPQGGTSQIIVQGRLHGQASARDYQTLKAGLMPPILESFGRLGRACDIVVVEGAGSASETNLRRNDIANMGFARAARVPVVVVGDIDRGGVIASLVGTHTVLDPADRAMIRGFLVNRMRGDLGLFADGMASIASATGWRALGLIPHFPEAAQLPAEDAADLRAGRLGSGRGDAVVRVAVPLLPHIANFDDLDPVAAEPGVELLMIPLDRPLPGDCDLVILPGSKATIADLDALRRAGWGVDLAAHRRRGGRILGICAGLQMLGRSVADPGGIEGPAGTTEGLGMLDVETVLTARKTLRAVSGRTLPDGTPVSGYEMHVGRTSGPDCARPFAMLEDGGAEGARAADGLVAGTALHGLFGNDAQRAWRLGVAGGRDHEAGIERILDGWAAHLEAHVDIDALLAMSSR
jgi:adenosylcobyric acid synthase